MESVTQKQISKSDPSLKGMYRALQEKFLIKLNTSFLLIFNLLLLGCGYHSRCDVSPDGKKFVLAQQMGKLFFQDHSMACVIRTIEAHSAPCTDVAYHPTLPSWVATCGWDGRVKVWT